MENIIVYVRLKPTDNNIGKNFFNDNKTLTNLKTKENYSFNSLVDQSMSNNDIFNKYIKNNLQNLLKGLNLSIILYGQTSSGKTHTLKGSNNSEEGIINFSIKEIFNLLKNDNIKKYNVKLSYFQIYNETIDDLLDLSKKNLEIKENFNRTFINGLSELLITNEEKALQLLNKGENNRINLETKKGDMGSKSHNIFKITIDYYIEDKRFNKERKFSSQMNFIEIAGSENLSNKDKSDGNVNKSLISFNNTINKLNQNNRCFINYKECKLLRLLQNIFFENSKSIMICTIIDENKNYEETVKTLKFGKNAKNVKIFKKMNNFMNKGYKKSNETLALKNKIKVLEKIINNKKLVKEKNNTSNKNKINSTNSKNESKNNEQISNLEKEVALLKKYLMSNEEMNTEMHSIQDGSDWMSVQGGNDMCEPSFYDGGMSVYNVTAQKPSFNPAYNFSAIRGLGSAMKSSYFNSPFRQNNFNYKFNNMSNIKNLGNNNNNNFKKNICFTEMRPKAPYPQINFIHNTIGKTAPPQNNFDGNKFSIPDFNTNTNSNNNNFIKLENDELKNKISELKSNYEQIIQNKDEQISLLNQNHNISMQNYENMIKDAEVNYTKLKSEYDKALEKMNSQESELNDLKLQNVEQDNSINFYKSELKKVGDLNYANDLQNKCDVLIEENLKFKDKNEHEVIQLQEENELLKKNIDMIENKYKEKCRQLNENKKSLNEIKKQQEKEIQKYKVEMKNFEVIYKGKGGNKNNKMNDNEKNKIKEYEDKIEKLIQENNEYKDNYEKMENKEILEYQKLLDDSFDKIAQLNKEINDTKEKNKYLESLMKTNIEEKENKSQNIIDISEEDYESENKNEDINKIVSSNNLNKGNNKEFINKKRKFDTKSQEIMKNNDINLLDDKENKNINNMEFSNFEL